MQLIKIAWRNFCHRALSSFLTTLSLALGVALVVAVLAIYGIISDAFVRNASVGYNLVVGPPKGSPLQLTLSSVYYLSPPVENLPFTEYMEFLPREQREALVRNHGGDPTLGQRDGVYAGFVRGGYVIPICLGDYFKKYRIVGTIPEFFEELRHGMDVDEPFEFERGRALKTYTPEHSYYEAVVGSRVAAEEGVKVGDEIYPTHGDPEGVGHGQPFTVVGVLRPTGTPNDRVMFVNMEGFYLLDKHAKPVPEDAVVEPPAPAADGRPPGLTIPQREVTSLLVRNGMILMAPIMENRINESMRAQAAAPIGQIQNLMEAIIGPISTALLVITILTCVVAAIGTLVAIYNSMSERRRDIAVMRALGARRDTVTAIILLESGLIAVVGGLAGWLIAHVGIWVASGRIEEQTGVQAGLLTFTPYEWLVLPLVIGLSLIAGLLPAAAAYRTDVSSNLAA